MIEILTMWRTHFRFTQLYQKKKQFIKLLNIMLFYYKWKQSINVMREIELKNLVYEEFKWCLAHKFMLIVYFYGFIKFRQFFLGRFSFHDEREKNLIEKTRDFGCVDMMSMTISTITTVLFNLWHSKQKRWARRDTMYKETDRVDCIVTLFCRFRK